MKIASQEHHHRTLQVSACRHSMPAFNAVDALSDDDHTQLQRTPPRKLESIDQLSDEEAFKVAPSSKKRRKSESGRQADLQHPALVRAKLVRLVSSRCACLFQARGRGENCLALFKGDVDALTELRIGLAKLRSSDMDLRVSHLKFIPQGSLVSFHLLR